MEREHDELWDKSSRIATVQELLSDLSNEDKISDFLAEVRELGELTTERDVVVFVRLVERMSCFRPEYVPVYAKMLAQVKSSMPDVEVSQIVTKKMMSSLFSWDDCAEMDACFLVHHLIVCGVVSIDSLIRKLSKRYFRRAVYGQVRTSQAWGQLFLYFGPEIYEADPGFYEEHLNSDFSDISTLPKGLRKLAQECRRENWDALKRNRMVAHANDKLLKMLMEDDVPMLRDLASSPEFRMDEPVVVTPLCPFYHIEMRPSIIGMAAGLGAANCFKFLLEHGARTDLLTDNNTSLVQLAVDGGSIEILRILEQTGCSFCGCMQAATTFFRREIFDWYASSHTLDLEEKAPTRSTLLGQACSSNNVYAAMYAIEHGAQLNAPDGGQEYPLDRASEFGSQQVVALLLSEESVRSDTERMMSSIGLAIVCGYPDTLTDLLKWAKIPEAEATIFAAAAVEHSHKTCLKIVLDSCPELRTRETLQFLACFPVPCHTVSIRKTLMNHYGEVAVEWLRSLDEEQWQLMMQAALDYGERSLFEEIQEQYAMYGEKRDGNDAQCSRLSADE